MFWFCFVIITIPSFSNIHQSAAFYQKKLKRKHTNQTKGKKDIYNHKEIYINFHKQKVKGLKQNGMQLFVKEFNKKDRRC